MKEWKMHNMENDRKCTPWKMTENVYTKMSGSACFTEFRIGKEFTVRKEFRVGIGFMIGKEFMV